MWYTKDTGLLIESIAAVKFFKSEEDALQSRTAFGITNATLPSFFKAFKVDFEVFFSNNETA